MTTEVNCPHCNYEHDLYFSDYDTKEVECDCGCKFDVDITVEISTDINCIVYPDEQAENKQEFDPNQLVMEF